MLGNLQHLMSNVLISSFAAYKSVQSRGTLQNFGFPRHDIIYDLRERNDVHFCLSMKKFSARAISRYRILLKCLQQSRCNCLLKIAINDLKANSVQLRQCHITHHICLEKCGVPNHHHISNRAKYHANRAKYRAHRARYRARTLHT